MYKKMYLTLFDAITCALAEMRNKAYDEAEWLLMKAQQESEEIYLESGEEEKT